MVINLTEFVINFPETVPINLNFYVRKQNCRHTVDIEIGVKNNRQITFINCVALFHF